MNRFLYTSLRSFSGVCKLLCVAACIFLGATTAKAAAPTITFVSVNGGTPGVTSVVISGTGFYPSADSNTVYFGATKATINSASATLLTVTVPVGALYAPITVLNLTNALSIVYTKPFAPLYDNSCFIPGTYRFKARADFALATEADASPTPYASAIGDLDGDGLPDLVVCTYDPVFASGYGNVSILHSYRNTSVNGVLSYAPAITDTISVGGGGVKMADLDGDGRLDVIVTCNGSGHLSILRNYSTPGNINLTFKNDYIAFHSVNSNHLQGPYESAIADFDGDGLLDIAVCSIDDTGYSENQVEIFRNLLSAPIIGGAAFPSTMFANNASVDFPVGLLPLSLVATDFDGDGKIDIATSLYGADTICVLKNLSVPGTFIFQNRVSFSCGSSNGGGFLETVGGDFDGDGKQDIAVVNGLDNTLTVFRNTATTGIINGASFAAPVIFPLPGLRPTGMSLGDFNGDGKLDIAISNNVSSDLTVLKNTSVGSSINFLTNFNYATSGSPVGVVVGDVDGDTKPDIVVTSNAANFVSVFEQVQTPDTTTIRGTDSVCVLASVTLKDAHCAGSRGYWISSNGHATVSFTAGSALDTTATISGVSPGIDTITYAVVYLSDTNYVRRIVRVLPLADTGGITGASTVCELATISLTESVSGGVWSSTNGSVATVDAVTGVVSGVVAGNTTILYTASSLSCGTLSAHHPIIVRAAPHAGIINGTDGTCPGGSFTLTIGGSPTAAGTWVNPHPFVATDVPSGITDAITGSHIGGDTILYIVPSTFCGSDTATKPIGILNITGTSFPIMGSIFACVNDSVILTNTAVGGTWSTTTPLTATVNASTGAVTGLPGSAGGIATIHYHVTYGCATADTFTSIPINAQPFAGAITGATHVCAGSQTTLSITGTTIGTTVWSSNSPSIATITSGGVLGGVVGGVDTIFYIASNVCGADTARYGDTILALPFAGNIVGAGTVFVGSQLQLTNPTGDFGGTWTADSPSVATVSVLGTVNALTFGNDIITYSVTNNCGTSTDTALVHVLRVPPPVINSVSVLNGIPLVTTIIITGHDFNDTAGRNEVYFGATQGTITSTSSTLLTVTLPIGALYKEISVINLGTRLTGLFNKTFTPLYDTGCYIPGTERFKSAVNFALAPSTASTGGQPYDVAIGDVDGDGLADLVVCTDDPLIPNTGRSLIHTYRNTSVNGVLSYAAPIVDTIGSGGRAVQLADIDGDGKLDVIVACGGSGRISINRNYSTPGNIALSLFTGFAVDASQNGPFGMTIADFDGDGKMDIAVIENDPTTPTPGPGSVEIFRNIMISPIAAGLAFSPGGTFASHLVKLPVGVQPRSITSADFDGDRKEDIVVSNFVDNTVSLLRNISQPDTFIFEPQVVYNCGTNPLGIQAMDINGDGKPEICVANFTSSNLTVFQNNISAPGSFTPGSFSSTSTPAGTFPIGVAGGDLNGDGRVDIAVTNDGGTISVIRNVLTGSVISAASFAAPITYSTGATNPIGVSIGDLDGDTKPDIVLANRGSNNISIFENTATPDTISIRGADSVCLLASITLSNNHCNKSRDYWSATNSHVSVTFTAGAATDSNAVITGVSVGTDTIICATVYLSDTNFTRHIIRVLQLADTGSITGAASVCELASTTLTQSVGGGTWSSTVGTVATVNALTGVVTGVNAGSTVLLYTTQSLSCGPLSAHHAITVNTTPHAGTISGLGGACVGTSITMTSVGASAAGTWFNYHPAVATASPSGLTDVVTGASVGIDTVIYYVTSAFCGTDTAFKQVGFINSTSPSFPIFAPAGLCLHDSFTLTNGAGGGHWTTSTPAIVTVNDTTGVVIGLSVGTAIISYHVSYPCATRDTFTSFPVNPLPVAGTLSGATHVCAGSQITITNSGSFGTSFVWSTTNGAISTVNGTGVVSGLSAGVDSIIYSATNGCGTVSAFRADTVLALPNPGSISGGNAVCIGATLSLSSTVLGGTWTSTNPARATVGALTGGVTGVSAGADSIIYKVTSPSCGSASDTTLITVNSLPNHGTINGLTHVCVGSNITLTNSGSFGTFSWRSSNPSVSTVSSSGVVGGVANGVDTIFYVVTTPTCGSDSTFILDTVNVAPNAGADVTWPTLVCPGTTGTLAVSGGSTGGTWTSLHPTIATVVAATGVFTGVAGGTDTVRYIVTNGCGSDTALTFITVTGHADSGTIVGTPFVCVNGITTLTDAIGAGTWATGSPLIATVTGGAVTGLQSGTAVISYTVSNLCGSATDTMLVTVNPLPNHGTLSGATHLCIGSHVTLTNSGSFGTATWRSSNPSVSTVSASGVVGAAASGADTIFYIVTTPTCGSDSTFILDTVNALPNAGADVTWPSLVCPGTTGTLTVSGGDAGGTWTSLHPTIATVVAATGVFTGVAGGTDTVRYIVTNGCGSDTALTFITVTGHPDSGTIVGTPFVCLNAITTLTDAIGAGTWATGSPLIATVTGGAVTGLLTGTAVISYTVSNLCGSATDTMLVTVNPLPNHGTISGLTHVCVGSHVTLTNSGSFGTATWRSSTPSIATVSASGVVGGVANGIDTIFYIVTTPTCGSDSTFILDTVNVAPNPGGISTLVGAVCPGTTVTLVNPTGDAGGTWVSVSPSVATVVASTGMITGVSGGNDTIRYVVTNGCGSDSVFNVVHITARPDSGTITGTPFVCIGTVTTLVDLTATGGTITWASSDTTIAKVVGGVVTGIASGNATISYSVNNACGTATDTMMVTVNPGLPASIINAANLCVGNVVTLSTSVPGGTWNTTAPLIATVTGGVVTALAQGVAIISYTITNGCNTATDTALITVNPLPNAGTLTGVPSLTHVCAGASTTLSSSTPGGNWSTTNIRATVNGSGVVTGHISGTDTVLYVVSTPTCGSATDSAIITIDTLPPTGTITGLSSVCAGSLLTLSDLTLGGTWSTLNPVRAVVNASGVVHALVAGTDSVFYATTNACGSDSAVFAITINPLANAGAIAGPVNICVGSATTFTDGSAGGNWSIGNSTVATITAGGVVTGLIAGVDTISYIVTTPCGADTAHYAITVTKLPSAGFITGSSSVCVGATITLSDTTSGGVWSSTNLAAATISATGVVYGLTADTTIIHYTYTNFCGTADTTDTVIVKPLPFAGAITGTASLCIGASGFLGNTTTGGTWSSSLPGIVSITTTGAGPDSSIVTGIAAGTAVIRYVVTNSCGSDTASHTIVVNPFPVLTSTLTPPAICSGTLFNYVPASSSPSPTFAWTRAAVPTITNPAASGTGTINEALTSTNVLPVNVVYAMTISALGCANVQNITVTVLPIPVLSSSISLTACSNTVINYIATSATPGTSFAWIRPAVGGITPATGSGTNSISETLLNSTTGSIPVVYIFTLTAAGCTNTENLNVTVERQAPPPPVITTHSPSFLCSGTMFQNFGASTTPPAGVTYGWSTRGADVWATGNTRQYCLVNFENPGLTWVILSASYAGFVCTSRDSFAVDVSGNVSEPAEVIYLNPAFACNPSYEDSYQWGYDDVHTLDSTLITGETNQGYINAFPDFVNNYYWVITTHHGCMQKTYYKIPTAIQNVNGAGVKEVTISPNPNNGAFEVDVVSDYTEHGSIIVTNVVGEKIMEQPFVTNTKMSMQVDQAAGIYFVNVITPHGKYTGKVIITR